MASAPAARDAQRGRRARGPGQPRSRREPGSAGARPRRGRGDAGCGRPAEPPPPSARQRRARPVERRAGGGEADRRTDGRADARHRPGAGGSPGLRPAGAGGKPGTRAPNFPRTRCQGGCFLFDRYIFENVFLSPAPLTHCPPPSDGEAEMQGAVTWVEKGSRGEWP